MANITLVFQTHWDREWYYSLDTYNMRLLKVMQRFIDLIESDEIDTFVFDGQVKALEDYLTLIDDQMTDKVLKLVKDKRIIIGPWYVLSDEFLVTGESLIRNLEMGIKKAKSFGNYQPVGYLPDTFGHVSQMPQILKQFKIEDGILWRGVSTEELFFTWVGADDTPLFSAFLKEGYYQPIIEQENSETLLTNWLKKHNETQKVSSYLLTNGGDHLMPSAVSIQKSLKTLTEKTRHTFKIDSYESYLKQHKHILPKVSFKGELRNNENAHVLPNVLSTRYPIKQENQWLENALTAHIEPLIALSYGDNPYPYQNYLDQTWERLLENHPHDSICGCSIDSVHKEMMIRFQKANDQIKAIEKDAITHLGLYEETKNYSTNPTKIFDDYTQFTVYNPTAYERTGYKKVKLFINEASELVDNFVVTDNDTIYTTTILSKKKDRIFESPLDNMPEFRKGYTYEILFKVNQIPGYGLKRYTLKKGNTNHLVSSKDAAIENTRYKVTINSDGSLNVFDKKTHKNYAKTHVIYSSLDAGDEYNYSKPLNDTISNTKVVEVEVAKTKHIEELKCHLEITLPKSLSDDRLEATEEVVTNKLTLTVHLIENDHNIRCELVYENKAKDQRTRLRFIDDAITHHYSDTAFDLVKRDVRDEHFKAEKGREVPVVVDPSLSMIYTDNKFRFNHIGLQEYQVNNGKEDSALDITLLRSVSHLSRDDLASRGNGAGPSFETPDAQLLGTHHYKYQFSYDANNALASSYSFKNDLTAFKGHVETPKYLLEIDNHKINISSLRKLKAGIELRIFNPYEKAEHFSIKTARPIKSIQPVNAFSDPIEVDNMFTLKPKEIRSYYILFDKETIYETDVLVTGGSIGGVIAAKVLADKGHNVILTEASEWIGGQLTNQGVPLDEHPFIESFGATKSYRAFRDSVRRYYHETYKLEPYNHLLNPGNAWVTRLSFEPKVALSLFEKMLEPYRNLTVKHHYLPISSVSTHDTVDTVTFKNTDTGEYITIKAKIVLDATDTGDLLPLTQTAYNVGAESKAETAEPNAKAKKNIYDMQPVTHVAALKWDESATKTIDRPSLYETFKAVITPYDNHSIISEYGPDSNTQKARKFNIMQGRMPLWSYRRIFDPKTLKTEGQERTLLNWPQNDYFFGNVFDCENAIEHKERAKEITKAFIYYLQTEVPNDTGGKGYPQIQIDYDTLGTNDGLAMQPYIRESRRIKALKTVVEQDVSAKTNETLPHVKHSVGIGSYHIDLHITTQSNTFFYDNTWPFEIPLEALIPVKKTNLLPACKNIGTTHLTNGCFRLHPVEWNIGEVAGHLSHYLLSHDLDSHEFIENSNHIENFKIELDKAGINRHWPKDKVHVI